MILGFIRLWWLLYPLNLVVSVSDIISLVLTRRLYFNLYIIKLFIILWFIVLLFIYDILLVYLILALLIIVVIFLVKVQIAVVDIQVLLWLCIFAEITLCSVSHCSSLVLNWFYIYWRVNTLRFLWYLF